MASEAEAPQRRKDPSGWDSLAERLLENNYLLTALELYTESLEAGREIPRLRDFFSNPGNFGPTQPQPLSGLVRSASVSTFDSLDVSRFSDDGHDAGDDRLAVLEFELRKAKETIASLRGSLTHAAETEQAPRDGNASTAVEVAKPHEVRALNFLLNQFLLKTTRRLTSITFSDEVEAQDLESWDSVGLDTPQPPELLQLYRNYSTHVSSNFTVLQENERLASELSSLEAELISLRRENEKSQARIRDLEKRASLSTPSITIGNNSGTRHTIASVEPIMEVPSNTSIDNQSLASTAAAAAPSVEDDNVTVTSEGDDGATGAQPAPSDSTAPLDESESTVERDKQGVIASASAGSIINTALASDDFPTSTSPSDVAGILDRPMSLRNSRSMSTAFRQALLASSQTNTESRLAKEVTKLMSGGQDCVVVLGRALPHIVPNVLLNKRDELIPLLLCAATQHPEERDRDQLLNFLFNLIKKPNAEQRQMIITGCVAFAKHNGPVRLEAELLPQCWEQISHKYAERRLLVAESCGALAPYLPTELRSSLLLSMLKQMLADDKSEEVRAAVTRTLGIVVAFIDDSDKYTQCYELLANTLLDGEMIVVEAARHVFLPALAAWAYELQILESRLLACLMAQINTLVTKVSNSVSGQDEEEKVLRQEEGLVSWVATYEALLTWQVASILQGGPFAAYICPDLEDEAAYQSQASAEPLLDLAVIVGSGEDVIRLRALFDQYTGAESWEQWTEVRWLLTDFLPKLTDFLIQLDVSLAKAVSSFTQLLFSLCRLLGRSFVNSRIRPFFNTILCPDNLTDRPSSARVAALCSALLPCFICGVLTCFPEDRSVLTSTLHKLLCFMALNVLPLESMQMTFLLLAEDKQLHMPLVDALWESLRSSTIQIRCATASLLDLLIKDVDETLVASRFVPALVTLASDDDMAVRVATVAGFGSLMECAKQKSLLEKAQVQLASFLDEPAYEFEHAIHVELIKTLGRIGPNSEPSFRDQFVLPRLHSLAQRNNEMTNKTKRRDITMELLEAFRTLSCCFIPAEQVAEHLVPALRCLMTDVQDVDPDSVDAVKAMISEVESKSSDTSGAITRSPGADMGAKTRFMRAILRRESQQSLGAPASTLPGSQSPKPGGRDVRAFFRMNKQS